MLTSKFDWPKHFHSLTASHATMNCDVSLAFAVALVWRWLAKDNLPHVLRQEPSPVSLRESAHRVRFPMRLTRLESFQDLTQRIVWCAFIRDELSNGVGDQKAVTWGNQRCSDKLLQLKLQLSQDHTHHEPVAH